MNNTEFKLTCHDCGCDISDATDEQNDTYCSACVDTHCLQCGIILIEDEKDFCIGCEPFFINSTSRQRYVTAKRAQIAHVGILNA